MRIRVDGAVDRPGWIEIEALRQEEREPIAFDFRCAEGWIRPDARWEGVRLGKTLGAFGPDADAPFIEIASGPFVAVARASEALLKGFLALASEGALLTPATGGPVRFVMPEVDCFTNVKAVDRLTLVATASGETASRIALGRLAEKRGS